jgi:hypothetical protein
MNLCRRWKIIGGKHLTTWANQKAKESTSTKWITVDRKWKRETKVKIVTQRFSKNCKFCGRA